MKDAELVILSQLNNRM